MEVTKDFWAGKRVFVTGHTGFKGSWLSYWLLRLGAAVHGYSRAPVTYPNLYGALRLENEMDSLEADISEGERLLTAIRASRAEVVFHLAAQALVYESYRQPFETYKINALGTAHVLEAIRSCTHVRAAVIVTSDKCYDLSANRERYAEEDALGGRDPYSSSKACAEAITAAYRTCFFSHASNGHARAAIASARAGNVFGGGDWSPHRLIPDAIAAFLTDAPLSVRSPRAIRPWQYILDPLRGYLVLAQALIERGSEFARAWNFGPPQSHELTVETIVGMLAGAWGNGARWRCAPHEAEFQESAALRLDSTSAAQMLDWAPRVDLAEAVEKTVRWHREYAEGKEAARLVDRSLDRYECARVT